MLDRFRSGSSFSRWSRIVTWGFDTVPGLGRTGADDVDVELGKGSSELRPSVALATPGVRDTKHARLVALGCDGLPVALQVRPSRHEVSMARLGDVESKVREPTSGGVDEEKQSAPRSSLFDPGRFAAVDLDQLADARRAMSRGANLAVGSGARGVDLGRDHPAKEAFDRDLETATPLSFSAARVGPTSESCAGAIDTACSRSESRSCRLLARPPFFDTRPSGRSSRHSRWTCRRLPFSCSAALTWVRRRSSTRLRISSRFRSRRLIAGVPRWSLSALRPDTVGRGIRCFQSREARPVDMAPTA